MMAAKKDKPFLCAFCNVPGLTNTYCMNRAEMRGYNLYCCKECSAAAQRYTVEQWREANVLRKIYQTHYRTNNKERIKKLCANWYKRQIKNPHYNKTERFQLIKRKNQLIIMKRKYNGINTK